MTAHPNRAKHRPRRNPRPEDIRAARKKVGWTQAEVAGRMQTVPRVVQQWESGERSMHPAFFDLLERLVAEELARRAEVLASSR